MFEELKNFINLQIRKNPSVKIVATNGCFDVLHYGHVEMLKNAKSQGDLLIVGLNSDNSVKQLKGANRPINNENYRKKLLEELRCVDFVAIFNDSTCQDFLRAVRPNIYIKAGDYSLDSLNLKEKKELLDCGAEIKFVKFVNELSSTNILNRI